MTQLVDIVKPLEAELLGANAQFYSVSTDTRTLEPGQLFVALQGDNFDGHDYLLQAKQKRAAAAIISKDIDCEIPVLKVEDTTAALGKLAAYHRSQFSIPVIGITGSCGKTTTKTMVANILNQRASTLVNQSSFNNNIGVPLTLLRLQPEHQYAVVEMGTNHPGEIRYLTEIARPTVAMINNIAPAHLEGFGTVKGVATAKSEIFEGLSGEGVAIINADDSFADFISKQSEPHRQLRFGVQKKADIFARNVLLDTDGHPSFTLCTPKGEVEIQLPLVGEHNVMNALGAAACAFAINFDLKEIQAGLNTVPQVTMRLVQHKGLKQSLVIDDTYNANPLSFDAALRVLVHHKGKTILVIGDMGELGDSVEQYHRELGSKAYNLGVDYLLSVGNYSQLAAQAFGENGACYPNHKTLIVDLMKHLGPEVTVLVKGSRKAQMENVVHAIIAEE